MATAPCLKLFRLQLYQRELVKYETAVATKTGDRSFNLAHYPSSADLARQIARGWVLAKGSCGCQYYDSRHRLEYQ
ncbi:hypothetical protein POY19_25715, partial [Klebsiella pneumoniae]